MSFCHAPCPCNRRFIGKMSRIEAEQCLHRMKDGVFLIRESDARQGEYAIALRYRYSLNSTLCTLCCAGCHCALCCCRWKRMPKHIKICKHPDTRRFYVSDVTDFHSVWVSAQLPASHSPLTSPAPSPAGAGRLLPGQLPRCQLPWRGHHSAGPLQGRGVPATRTLNYHSSSSATPLPTPPAPALPSASP